METSFVPPEGVNTFAGRLATFKTEHRVGKRRASTKKKTTSTVSWPHTNPSAEDVAKAGFYYRPISSSDDNVTCFVCHKQLDGWEEGDNPAIEHITHSSNCPWALNASIIPRFDDPTHIEPDPLGETMADARRATFGKHWPHESKKGWKCKVKKMVEAGWCYDPVDEAEDGTVCFYCGLSLDGWEPKDDPFEEHQRRAESCPFFTLCDQYASTRQKSKGRKGRSSAVSKASRLSTQSNMTTFSEAPSLMSLGDDAAMEDDSVLTTATNTTTATRASRRGGRKQTTVKPAAAKRATRGRKATGTSEIIAIDDTQVEYPELEPEESATLEPVTPPRRATRTKATKAQPKARLSEDASQLQSELQDAVQRAAEEQISSPKRGTKRASDGVPKPDSSVVMVDAPPVEAAPVTKPKRTRKGTKGAHDAHKMAEPEPMPRDDVQEEVEVKPKRGRKPAKKDAVVEQPSVIEPPSQVDAVEVVEDEPKPKSKRGRKPKAAMEESSVIEPPTQNDTMEIVEAGSQPKPKRGRKPKAAVEGSSVIEPLTQTDAMDVVETESQPKPMRVRKPKAAVEVDLSNMVEVAAQAEAKEEEFAPKPKPPPKKGKGRPKKASKAREVEESELPEPSLDDFPAPPSSVQRELPPPPSVFGPVAFEPIDMEVDEPEPEPQAEPAQIEAPPTPQPPKEATPSPSPQSSDAENRPPSTLPPSKRPSLAAPASAQKQLQRVPLADTTPVQSPSKRNPNRIGALTSSHPWLPIDLETVFIQSPSSKAAYNTAVGSTNDDEEYDQENMTVDEAVKRVKATMTSPEKTMTVQEWIQYQAIKGEERLRSECERLVGAFETEGGRALRVLDGIECVR